MDPLFFFFFAKITSSFMKGVIDMKLRKYLYRLRSTEYLMKRTTRNLAKLKEISEENDETNERFMIHMDNLYLLEAVVYKLNDQVFLNRIYLVN